MLASHTTHVRTWLVGTLLVAGCTEPDRVTRAQGTGDDTDGVEMLVEIDEEAILSQAMAYRSNLQRLTDQPEQSETHVDAASVYVWGPADARDKINAINPDDPTQEVSFGEGMMIVKEHLDENDEVVGFTAMYKATTGYNPDARDWFWARVRGGNVTESGRVQWCSSCHAAAYNTDFVVGFAKSQ
jgi:hypothetical protein